jgi:hypothetical protein
MQPMAALFKLSASPHMVTSGDTGEQRPATLLMPWQTIFFQSCTGLHRMQIPQTMQLMVDTVRANNAPSYLLITI